MLAHLTEKKLTDLNYDPVPIPVKETSVDYARMASGHQSLADTGILKYSRTVNYNPVNLDVIKPKPPAVSMGKAPRIPTQQKPREDTREYDPKPEVLKRAPPSIVGMGQLTARKPLLNNGYGAELMMKYQPDIDHIPRVKGAVEFKRMTGHEESENLMAREHEAGTDRVRCCFSTATQNNAMCCLLHRITMILDSDIVCTNSCMM
eukprot:TRINITY_DN622_c0_g1_i4.p1 TRINITY_DN622_c0_g1~~TRINITY_DN622_c0_g1_i4.p1  ORF type:complete len:205 (+),score=46.69 TRINITY_DN622_c0_g1_i4:238-852(+)